MLNDLLGWWRRTFWRHQWEYRNPYDRKCCVCGAHEVSHCASMETWHRSWWEAWNKGDYQKHWRAPNGKAQGLAETKPNNFEERQ